MISHVYAEGFRSLDKFSIDLMPGLNVLVGPNGGGKTNILALFSFISAVSSAELGEAINASGGASKVFRKTGKTSFVKELKIRVRGEQKYSRQIYLPQPYEKRLIEAGYIGIRYDWCFKIDSSFGYDEAFYSEQILKAKLITSTLFSEEEDGNWDFEILSKSRTPQEVALTETIHNPEAAGLIRQKTREDKGEPFFINSNDEFTNSSLPIFFGLGTAYILRQIHRDMQGGLTFNFDPAICKQPNDSAQSPTLEKNGRGLAATIYAIQKSHTHIRSPYVYPTRRVYNRNTAKSLQQYFQLINPAVGSIKAINNPFDNKIVVQFSVNSDEENVEFPLELASDGTVKWLAFTVALLTQNSGFSIEEPENFLHPDIQRHAIELIRTETDGAENLHVLMTTHSETLLNAARPEELIIVSMGGGVTSAKRIGDPELIDEEIRETGFGLGYYYISGALND